jgi:hypothetical protein
MTVQTVSGAILIVVFLLLVFDLSKTMAAGIRTGRIAFVNKTTFCEKAHHPFAFWFLFLLYLAFALLFLLVSLVFIVSVIS